jgi:glycosyltransferase involved in cell wall biosynthesis
VSDPQAAAPPWLRRVVFVCRQIPELGGGGTAIESLSEALVAAGVPVEHVSIFPGTRPPAFPTRTIFGLGDAHRASAFRDARGPWARARGLLLVARKRVDLRVGRRHLRRLMRTLDERDVVVFTNVFAKMKLDESGYRPSGPGPIVVGQHHSSFEGAGTTWERDALAQHFADADLFLALTEEDARKFQAIIPVPCSSVPNPVQRLAATERRPRPIAVALARYSHEKQLDLMIRAFKLAIADSALADWELHLHGDGDMRGDLADLIRRESLEERVRLMGRTNDVAAVLATAEINLLSSKFEGFPMSILEAASMGVPTIAFDCSAGVRELVPEGGGVLVAPNDLSGYAAALHRMMSDPVARAAMGANARGSLGRFQGPAVTMRWFDLLEECQQRRHERAPRSPSIEAVQ